MAKKFNWQHHTAYDLADKKAFHRQAKKRLKLLAEALGLDPADYDLRSNPAGIAVSGEITLHADWIYVQVSQGWSERTGILFRSCQSRQDYTGGQNHFAPLEMLDEIDELTSLCRRIHGDRPSMGTCFAVHHKA